MQIELIYDPKYLFSLLIECLNGALLTFAYINYTYSPFRKYHTKKYVLSLFMEYIIIGVEYSYKAGGIYFAGYFIADSSKRC